MTGQPGSGAGGLTRYVVAATLARTADGGGVVAIVLRVSFTKQRFFANVVAWAVGRDSSEGS